MKIFFEDRTIELLNACPENVPAGTVIEEFKPGKEFEKVVAGFLNGSASYNLMIWSKKNGKKLKKRFQMHFRLLDAAGGIVRNENREILFIFRLGKWDLPKGKLKRNETPGQGALREVKEETGLRQVEIKHQLPSTFHIYQRGGKQILKQTFWFEMTAGSTQPLIPEEKENITDVAWVNPAAKEEVLKNTYASIRSLMRDYE
jgi:ADP-ribose pyrophosphatase YjhB (NUDIX family)